MKKRGSKPKGKISIEWSPDFSYAIGLIASDGNLSIDGRHIDFTSKDKSLIISFKQCLGLNVKIGRKTSGFTGRKDYYRIQFGDVLFYRWLIDFGLMPNKSKLLGSLRVPDKLFFDFLRGCYDGDGSIYAYWDPRWRSSYMFYLGFASASAPFLKWLQENIGRLASVYGKIDITSKTFQLRFAKKETLILFNKMFYRKDVPCLKRKFIKAQKIFKINQEHSNSARVTKMVNVHG